MLRWPTKRTHEVLDYSIDWAPRLGDDTIVDSAVVPGGGLVMDRKGVNGSTLTVWLSGGQPGVTKVLCTVTTAGRRTLEEVVAITVAA